MLNSSQKTRQTTIVVIIVINLIHITQSLDPIQESRCLNCIRNVSTSLGTDVSKRCEGYYCGPYQLSYTYWAEAGKPGNNQGSRDYEKCARDKTCAEQTVRAYFKKFKRDCNNDDQIDCLDMAALHKVGPTSCASDWFYKSRYWLAFNKTSCMTNREQMSDSSKSDYEDHSNSRPPVKVMKNQTLTPECLDCICDAVSGCNTSVNNCGSGTVCGPFAISQAYWKDGKRPGSSWTTCARTKECSSVAMKNYMEKYKRDCNDDGYITCEDYAAIHRRGPRACSNKDLLKDHYWNKFLACRANQKPVKDVNMVKVNEGNDESNAQSPANSLASRGDSNNFLSTATTTLTAFEQSPAANSSPESSNSQNNLINIITGNSQRPLNDRTSSMATTTSSAHFDYSQTPRYEQITSIAIMDTTKLDETNNAKSTSIQRTTYPLHSDHLQPHQFVSTSVSQDELVSDTTTKQKFELTSELKPELSSQEYRPFVPHTSSAHEQTIFSSRQPNDYDGLSPIIVVSRMPMPQNNNWPTTTSTTTTTTSTTTSTTTTTTTPAPAFSLITQPIGTTMATSSYTRTEAPLIMQPTSNQRPTSQDNLDDDMNSSTNPSQETSLSQVGEQQPQPIPTQPDQPILAPSDEIDYPDSSYPAQVGGGPGNTPYRTSNFDRTVIDIVSNKDFTKSYPPVPDLNPISDKQTSPGASSVDEFNTGLSSKFPPPLKVNSNKNGPTKLGPQIVVDTVPMKTTTLKNANPSLAQVSSLSTPNYTRSTISHSQSQYPSAQTSQQSSPQGKATTTSAQEAIQNDNSRSDFAPIFGPESMNITSLFDKALNESSRIASECLECICDASSNCDTSVQCISKQREKNRCGLYMISWNQYQESDISLTAIVPLSSGGGDESADEKMYYDCTTDKVCAEKLIHLYIEKHQKDCNNDGKIDCYDIAAIHRVGPENCNSGKFLGSQYWKDFNICYTTDRLTTTALPQASSQLYS